MRLSPKARIGSLLLVIAYLFWFAYVYVLQNDLFFYHPWIDIPFHLGGGFVIALLVALLILFRHSEIEILEFKHFVFPVLWGTMMVGVIWEYYEYFFKLYDTRGNLMIDTIADLGNDLIGAVLGLGLAYLIVVKTQRRKINNNSVR